MRTIFIVLFLFIPLASFADPTPDVKILMNAPVSIFDFGLLKLEVRLQAMMPEAEINVDYNWDKNRIIVRARYYATKDSLKKKTPKQICKDVTNKIKIPAMALGVYVLRSGEIYGSLDKTSAQLKAWTIMKQINDITYIEVEVLQASNKTMKILAHSFSTLKPDSILFKE